MPDYADDLLRQLQASGVPLRRMPGHLGNMLKARLDSGVPGKAPRHWNPKEPKLGYLALFQRILACALPESGVAEEYKEPLRLALSEALGRDIEELEFRHPKRAAAGKKGAPVVTPASTFLADILSQSYTEGILPYRIYSVLSRNLRLGRSMPMPDGYQPPPGFLNQLDPSVIREVETSNPAALHLTFARFARLIAAGILHGMRVRMLLDPNIDISNSSPFPSQAQLPSILNMAVFRLATLMALGNMQYEGRHLLLFANDPFLDAAAFVHLAQAQPYHENNARQARQAITDRFPGAFQVAEERFSARLVAERPARNVSGVCCLTRELPQRFLVETSTSSGDDHRSARAYLWLTLYGDAGGGESERLMRLDDMTSRSLARHLDEIWKAADR